MKNILTELAKCLAVMGLVLASLIIMFSVKFPIMTIYFH